MYFNLDIEGFFVFIIIAVAYIAQGIAFGIATNLVLSNRGYKTVNWFWWGFFFGFIAIIVAFSKPEKYEPVMDDREHSKSVLGSGGWVCSFCNTLNDNSVTSCSCGKNREDSEQHRREMERLEKSGISANNGASIKDENDAIELIAKYKKLLDSGAITQEEFDNKKHSLLSSL